MGDSTYHFEHAMHNHDFLRTFIEKYTANDWAITVGFYSILHFVEFSIARIKNFTVLGKKILIEHSEDFRAAADIAEIERSFGIDTDKRSQSQHKIRSLLINGAQEISPVALNYERFYTESRSARYSKYIITDKKLRWLFHNPYHEIIEWLNSNFKLSIPQIF